MCKPMQENKHPSQGKKKKAEINIVWLKKKTQNFFVRCLILKGYKPRGIGLL